MAIAMRPSCKWTNDCSGKKDYDGDVLTVSTRYWPRGGGFMVYDQSTGEFQDNDARPEIKPSAKSRLLLHHGDDDYETLVESEDFEGENFEEVAAQVESWVAEHYARAIAALQREFGVEGGARPASEADHTGNV